MNDLMNAPLDNNLNIQTTATAGQFTTSNAGQFTTSNTGNMTCWQYWTDYYYPHYHQSYPVYIQDRALDKGKQAFEIIKVLKDKKLVKLEKVSDFIDLMDELIKIL